MSALFYSLQIYCDTEKYFEINNILGVKSKDAQPSSIWNYEVVIRKDDDYFDFINEFMEILEGNYHELENIGIKRDSISLWFVYEYDEQCNMEFEALDLKRMGDNGVGLCISCY